MYEIQIYRRIIRERGKKTKEKNRHEWRSVWSWKNNNVNTYTYWKKKRTKKKKDKNLLLTKKTKKKNYKNSDIPHCSHNCNKTNLLLTKKTRKKNYKNSDIPHCSHNCNKTNQHIVILLENLCSLKFFHVLQDSFKVPHLMDQGYKVNTSANYIHAYNESRFFYHKTSKCY